MRAVLLVGGARGRRDPERRAPTTQKQALLPGIASGDTIATLAFTEPSGKWDAAGITMEANENVGGEFTLSGEKMFVIDGFTADPIVVVARLAGTTGTDGITFFTVAGDAEGLTRTPLQTMDTTRKQAKLEFDNVVASPLGSTQDGFAAFSRRSTRPRSRSPTR